MSSLDIIKPITEESISHLFPHQDDLETVLEAVEDENIEYVPFWMIARLVNEGFIEKKVF